MGDTFVVRRFEPTDADAVWDVHEAALRASPLAFVEEAAVDEDVTEVESHYLEEGGEFLVGAVGAGAGGTGDAEANAAGDAEIVAIGGYLPIDGERVEIMRMRVDPDHQRRGFASAVLQELETRAREAGYGVADLETVEPLQAAQAFYEDAGYELVDEWIQEATGVAKYRYRKRL